MTLSDQLVWAHVCIEQMLTISYRYLFEQKSSKHLKSDLLRSVHKYISTFYHADRCWLCLYFCRVFTHTQSKDDSGKRTRCPIPPTARQVVNILCLTRAETNSFYFVYLQTQWNIDTNIITSTWKSHELNHFVLNYNNRQLCHTIS